jgi:shikimate dehydrogenase
MTDRYAVIGNPIAHSKSPVIHAAFARQTGQDLTYERILGPVGGFQVAVDAFRAEGGRGLSVTLPFKLEACAYATDLSDRAEAAGAVNTLKFEGADTFGDNTDGAGLVRDVQGNLGVPLRAKRVLIAGAGGAAQGLVVPIFACGVADLVVANRTLSKAETLAARFAERGPVSASSFEALAEQRFDVVINATAASIGGECPPLPAVVYEDCALAYELMYGRGETPFMQQALAGGAAKVADGLGMLVEQAAEAFELWRGVRPDTAPVLVLLRRAT